MWWAELLNNLVAQLGTGAGASASSFESIATVTAAGGEASLSFSSIPSTYKHLQLRFIAKTTNTAAAPQYFYARFNSDSTAANYAWHKLSGDGTTAAASGSTNDGQCYFEFGATATNAAFTSIYGAGFIDIQDYASTSKNKTIRSFTGIDNNGTLGRIHLESNLWINTAALSSISLFNDNTWAAGSTFALYGIKG